jgi:RNA polymerase sigma-70 factor (ECF subfamily)
MDPRERKELSAMMARLAEGDRDAFTPVFAALWPELRRLAGALLRDGADADDAAQRALVSVMSRAHEYDRSRDALPWAVGIALWECRTILRRRERSRTGPLVDDAIASSESPEEIAIARDLERACLEVVGALSPTDRAALGLGDGDGASPQTVRKRRQRALVRLREAWSRIHGGR